jgi:hypothetical protein
VKIIGKAFQVEGRTSSKGQDYYCDTFDKKQRPTELKNNKKKRRNRMSKDVRKLGRRLVITVSLETILYLQRQMSSVRSG